MSAGAPQPPANRYALLRESPVAALAAGLFPSIAVTTRVDYALALAGGALLVLVGSRLIASLIAPVIPGVLRFLAHLFVIAILVTGVDLTLRAYAPSLSRSLGIYVPLLAVNCLFLGRLMADRGALARSVLDALGMGLAFGVSLILIALVRETLGSGTITLLPIRGWSIRIPGLVRAPIGALVLPGGAFLVVGYLLALSNWMRQRRESARRLREQREGSAADDPNEGEPENRKPPREQAHLQGSRGREARGVAGESEAGERGAGAPGTTP